MKTHVGPLAGIKVLELGTLIAGPFCSRILAEFGAEIIKVESPDGGDPIRRWRVLRDGTSLWWSVQARNKKSLTLNLKEQRGQEIAKELALNADIVIENFRPGVLEKWQLGYEQLKSINPSLIMVRLSGYGQTGPMKNEPGFGATGEAMGGLRYVSGHPDRPPVRVGISIGDSIAALHGVIGALLALHYRNATGGRWTNRSKKNTGGQGQMVDVALYESVFNIMESLIPEYDYAGVVRERTGTSLPGIVPSSTYVTKDKKHIVIAGNGDAIFKRLMYAINRGDLANNPELANNDGRVTQIKKIETAIQNWCYSHSSEDILTELKLAQVPVSKIFSVKDMMDDPQFLAREMFQQCTFRDGSPIKLPTVLPKLSATPGSTRWLGPQLGEHNEEILLSLGYSKMDIVSFRAQGVI